MAPGYTAVSPAIAGIPPSVAENAQASSVSIPPSAPAGSLTRRRSSSLSNKQQQQQMTITYASLGPNENFARRITEFNDLAKLWGGKQTGQSPNLPLSSSAPFASLSGAAGTAPSAGGASSNIPPTSLSEEEFSAQWSRKPRRIALFVEPSPFAYVCGYKNRFQNFIRYLREMGDEVLIITTHKGVPKEFYGAHIIGSWSFPCPWYNILPLSLALSPRIVKAVADFKPDLIHASSPGVMCFGALIIAKMLSLPFVLSYHTHVPVYIPKYTFAFLVGPMWAVIRLLHRAADITLVTSHALGKELAAFGAALTERIKVWRKGVDSDSFHPRYKSQETRKKLTANEPEKPLIVHVGRLGAEKNLDLLLPIMKRIPGARLAFVGDGPFRPELEKMFAGTPTVFTGMLQGDELSEAYASGDIFITPSESETLGFVVLEAMASGVPVVAARAGGIPDIVSQPGVTGFLFEPGSVDEAVGQLQSLIKSPELRQKMASAARSDVEKFDWRASTKSVRSEAYSAAVQLFHKKKEAKRSWLPWWTKKQDKQLTA
eukprot:TRINITY_DN1560_c0_g1_i1.p1 TRINITY_DN1560_c0_g1~~TRINITY_DN1560_c0_g1_i1.p1  ORF type:complete len:544 (+),score=87.47 TRINITY_DN1560_c0_g1_i1:185-1816(+)